MVNDYVSELNATIDVWIDAMDGYDFKTLLIKPDESSWSLGQVYLHILNDTNYYCDQVDYCLSHNENESGTMIEFALKFFTNNGLPDQKLEGDPSNQNIPQPTSKEELALRLNLLKARLNDLWNQVEENKPLSKAKHPGFGYFSAEEWLRFAEVHMRHHLRQKERIEYGTGRKSY